MLRRYGWGADRCAVVARDLEFPEEKRPRTKSGGGRGHEPQENNRREDADKHNTTTQGRGYQRIVCD